MDISGKRRSQLLNHINFDTDLLKEYEDKLRTESDPSQKSLCKSNIVEIKERLTRYETELNTTNWDEKERLFREKPPENLSQNNPQIEDEVSSTRALDKTTSKSIINQEGVDQILEAIAYLRDLLKEDLSESSNIDDFYLLRLQLLTSRLLTKKIVSSALNTHEANLLYLMRERLKPLTIELSALLKMLVGDESGYKPGWYWFRKAKGEGIESVILSLALYDQYDWLRQQAFKLAEAAKIQLPDDLIESVSWSVSSDSIEVRQAALSFLGKVGNSKHLPIIRKAFTQGEKKVIHQAKVSKILILTRIDPIKAFSELLSETGLDDQEIENILDELFGKEKNIPSSTLFKSLENPNNEIRLFSVNELLKRSELTLELAKRLEKDNYSPIKIISYQILFEQKIEIKPEDIYIPDDYLERHLTRDLLIKRPSNIERDKTIWLYYQRYSFNELIKMLDWQIFNSADIYRVLALENFDEFGEQLRTDLRCDFKQEAEKYYQHQFEWYKESSTTNKINLSGFLRFLQPPQKTPEQEAEGSVERKKAEYIRVALAGLAKNGSPEDIEFGRRYLFHSDEDVRIEAVRIVQRWGNQSDLEKLIKLSKESSNLLQELAAKAVLKISNNALDIVNGFLLTGNQILVSMTIAELLSHEDRDIYSDFLKPFLYNSNDEIRSRVMAFFVFQYNSTELTGLLKEYTSEPTYYYNVVTCFDRVLYAPENIRAVYRKLIEEQFFGFLT